MSTESENRLTLAIHMAITAWQIQNSRMDKLLTDFSDEQLMGDIAPGKNSGVYLLGHLIAVNENLFPLFGLGPRIYPQYDDLFLKSPDKSGRPFPALKELRAQWQETNSRLTQHFERMSAEDWFAKHTAVSEEDFKKEPHRNKLNVLLNRTAHQAYHLGQLMLLKK
jgi:hypothetical protein